MYLSLTNLAQLDLGEVASGNMYGNPRTATQKAVDMSIAICIKFMKQLRKGDPQNDQQWKERRN